jgi:hypothetical protein
MAASNNGSTGHQQRNALRYNKIYMGSDSRCHLQQIVTTIVPAGAQIISVAVRAGATGEAVPTTGTAITVLVGGTAVSAAVNRSGNYDAVGDSYTQAALFYTDAGRDNGAIGVTYYRST